MALGKVLGHGAGAAAGGRIVCRLSFSLQPFWVLMDVGNGELASVREQELPDGTWELPASLEMLGACSGGQDGSVFPAPG